MSLKQAFLNDLLDEHPNLMQGIAGAGAYGLGQVTNNPILGALGGGLLGNLGGTMTNNAIGGNENMQKVLGLGGMLAGGIGGYRQLANAQSRPAQEQKQAMLDPHIIDGTPIGQQLTNLLGAGGRMLQRNARPLMQAGVGAGLLGAGQAMDSRILKGLGGATLGNIPGAVFGDYLANQNSQAIPGGTIYQTLPQNMRNRWGAIGALAGGGLGAAIPNSREEPKQAMLDDIYNMGLDAAIDQFTKSAGIKRRIGKTYRRIIGKPSVRDRVENGVDAVRDRVSGPINSAKNLGSSAVNAVKKTWNDYSNKGEE